MMKVSPSGIHLIQSFEGCRLTAYQDAGGVWTIGWGSTHTPSGVPISADMTVTQAEADAWFSDTLEMVAARVSGLLRVRATQPEFDALCAFAYNVGVNALASSTLLRLFNAEAVVDASLEFPKWCHVGTRPMLGLARRRFAEATLFLSDPP